MTTLQITRSSDVLPEEEVAALRPILDDIERLKVERNAIVAAHNYMTPDIYHLAADITGDSLALAQLALDTEAEVIVLAGVHFMAETAKIINPEQDRPDPGSRGRMLTGRWHHRGRCPPSKGAVPGRAGGHLCQHLGRGQGRVGHHLHFLQRRGGGGVARGGPGHLHPRPVPRPMGRHPDRRRGDHLGGLAASSTSGSPARRSPTTGRHMATSR